MNIFCDWEIYIYIYIYLSKNHVVKILVSATSDRKTDESTFHNIFLRQVLSVRVVCDNCFKILMIEILLSNHRLFHLSLKRNEQHNNATEKHQNINIISLHGAGDIREGLLFEIIYKIN